MVKSEIFYAVLKKTNLISCMLAAEGELPQCIKSSTHKIAPDPTVCFSNSVFICVHSSESLSTSYMH